MVPVLAKILEKLVASQLSTYFENFQLLNPYQGAYHIGRSTEQILLFAVDTITQALDAHQVVCTAFLDLRKAFDLLDHVILLKQLSALGIHYPGLLLTYLTVHRVSDIETWSPYGLL